VGAVKSASFPGCKPAAEKQAEKQQKKVAEKATKPGGRIF
jgi:hypothetical protein